MENQKNNKGVIALLVIVIIILVGLCVLLAIGTISFKNSNKVNETDNKEIKSNNSIYSVCTNMTGNDKLEILDMENKTETIGAIGGSTNGYNVTTTVTKEHNYTSIPEESELLAKDVFGTLFVLFENKLYYTNNSSIISKYCSNFDKLLCDYSKLNDDNIKEFNSANIDVDIKSIGTYGNSGSGAPTLYALTSGGKIIEISEDVSHNLNGCRIMYDSSEYPIDRIFNMYFYDGVEYNILLKDGTLITRDVDRDHPIVLEH